MIDGELLRIATQQSSVAVIVTGLVVGPDGFS